MTNELERQLAKLKQGDHVCLIYENPREKVEVAVPFIIDGLARGERCVYILDESGMEEIVPALAAAGVDVARERRRGALRFTTPEETFLRTGEFLAQAMMDIFAQAETEALADGFSGVRITGEPPWSALGREPGDGWFEYEALLSHLPKNSKTVILCRYNHAHFNDSCIPDVLQTHPGAILGDQVCANPYNEPAFVPSQGPQASADFKRKRAAWWIAELKRTRAAEQERERALEKLKQSERRLVEAQQVAHLGSWERDLRTNQVTWSDEMYRLFGLKAHEIDVSYERFLSFVVPQDADRIRAQVLEAIRERGPLEFDYRITRADGSVRFLHEQGNVILNEAGEPIRLIGTAQDVTERRRAEEEIRTQRETLQMIFDNAPVYLGLFAPDGRLVMINREVERNFGWTLRELEEQKRDFFVETFPDPAERQRVRRLIEAGAGEQSDLRVSTRDGRLIDLSAAAVVLSDGSRIGMALDITERKRAEQALRDNHELLQSVLATLPVSVVVTDVEGDIVLTNGASKSVWGDLIVSGGERRARSKGFWHQSGKRIEPEAWASVRALREGQTTLNELIDIETFDGQKKTMRNSTAPIRDARGTILGAVIVNEDVTEPVRAEEALHESAARLQALSRRLLEVQEEERRHLARELHDEFGQILAAITLRLHVARGLAAQAAFPPLDECAALLQQAGEQVRGLALELRPTMLDTLGLEAALHWLAEQHQQRTGCEVHVVGSLTESPLPPGLSIACFRVVQEALTNVARHAAAQHVWINLAQTDGVLVLDVHDDGVGFDVAPTQEQAVRRGSLGLLGMRERVEILGGTLRVESAAGHGAWIRAAFPLYFARSGMTQA